MFVVMYYKHMVFGLGFVIPRLYYIVTFKKEGKKERVHLINKLMILTSEVIVSRTGILHMLLSISCKTM